MKNILTISICTLISLNAFSLREPKPTAIDNRLKVITYSPNDVFVYTGYYGYQSSIEFGEDEQIVNISMGDTTSWQMVPSGNKLFLKPMESDATTNMTLITSKRTYFFELHAEEAIDIRDPKIVFNLKFLYPDEEMKKSIVSSKTSDSSIDLTHPEKYNFNYSISGNESIAPVKIFDDGEFTYMQFRDKNAEMPVFLSVDEDRKESIVNYHMSKDGKYIIIEQVSKMLVLRNGKKVTCIFNEAFRY